MTLTIDSCPSSAPYVSPADVFVYADVRPLADLVQDTGTRLGDPSDVTAIKAALTASASFLRLILAGIGQLESACLVGGRYAAADLAAIAASGTAAGERLKQVVAALVVNTHWRRRQRQSPGDMPADYAEALDDLQALREGQRVFGAAEVEQAGRFHGAVEKPSDVQARDGIEVVAGRFFGRRDDRAFRTPS